MTIGYTLPRLLSTAEQDFIRAALARSFNVEKLVFTADQLEIEMSDEVSDGRFGKNPYGLGYASISFLLYIDKTTDESFFYLKKRFDYVRRKSL